VHRLGRRRGALGEQKDGLAIGEPRLRAAEREGVDAGVDAQRATGRRGVELGAGHRVRHGVGEPGAVDVHAISMGVRERGQSGELGGAVDRAELGRVREREHPGGRLVDIAAAGAKDGPQVFRAEAGRLAARRDRRRATQGDALGRGRLVVVPVALGVAQDALPRLGEAGDGEGVGGRAGGDEERGGLGPEQRLDGRDGPRGEFVVAIPDGVAARRGDQAFHGLRDQARVVVRSKTGHPRTIARFERSLLTARRPGRSARSLDFARWRPRRTPRRRPRRCTPRRCAPG
jgi:hypothetical protein